MFSFQPVLPFTLTLIGHVVAPREKTEPTDHPPKPKPDPKVQAGPSRPNVTEIDGGPDDPPITIEKEPGSQRLKLLVNRGSRLLAEAKALRPPEEAVAVEFIFKYGLALTAMGLLDAMKKTPEWASNEADCRERVQQSAAGIARVIVPLCLSLPKKLPKMKTAHA